MPSWRRKAAVQRSIARLPRWIADPLYYAIQRRFGALGGPDLAEKLDLAVEVLEALARQQRRIEGATIVEVGTGRRATVPLLLWLAGAGSLTTVDLNRQLRGELVTEVLEAMRGARVGLVRRLAPFSGGDVERRLDTLLATGGRLERVLAATGIAYRAPADATRLEFADRSVDVHLSISVLEHVPPPVLDGILREARRVLRPDGLAVHFIDPSDHFSHQDASISPVHFLGFEEGTWHAIAGNRFAYHNRLRAGSFVAAFERTGLRVLERRDVVDDASLAALREGLVQSGTGFRGRPIEELATRRVDVVARPA